MKKLFLILISCFVLTACQAPQERQTGFEDAKPRSILILPIVNNSVDVDAPLAVYSSLPVMLAEKGYYVFPSNTVKTVLEYEGLYEPSEIQNLPTSNIAGMFSADTVLYVTIDKWDTTYLLLSSTTYVDFKYEIRSSNGEVLWKANKYIEYTPQNSSSGNALADLIGAALTAAVNRAAPDYMPLTRMANYQVFYHDQATYIPYGPYAEHLNKKPK